VLVLFVLLLSALFFFFLLLHFISLIFFLGRDSGDLNTSKLLEGTKGASTLVGTLFAVSLLLVGLCTLCFLQGKFST
jgi:hypothetical protein